LASPHLNSDGHRDILSAGYDGFSGPLLTFAFGLFTFRQQESRTMLVLTMTHVRMYLFKTKSDAQAFIDRYVIAD
jgi:hypothetical protein